MGLYAKHLLPRLTHHVCGQKPAMKQREKIIPQARGYVLEIGVGSGLNSPYSDPDRVNHLWGLDPSRDMWAIAQKNAESKHLDAEFIEAGAEEVPLENNSVDTVVMTYTLCTIPDPARALGEIRRVLKPGGKLLFCEHGEAPDESVRRWQQRLDPVWGLFAGGCHLGRPIPGILEAAGLCSTDLQTMYIPGWKPGCFNYWGTAHPV